MGVQIITAERAELDLTNKNDVFNFFQENLIDSVVLAAAKVGGIHANSLFPAEFLIENLLIQNSVIIAAKEAGVKNFIFLGSSCVYPRLAEQPILESSLLTSSLETSNEAYAIAKIAGIKMIEYIAFDEGVNYLSLMPSNVYGPNDNFDLKTSHVFAALMRKMHEAKINNLRSVSVWGTGKIRREFLSSEDLAYAIWFFLQSKAGAGKLINVGIGKDLSIREFAELMSSIVEFKGEIRFDTNKPDGTPRKLLDTRLATSLGWSSTISLKDGLEQTYGWFKENYEQGRIRGF
jgi:GDP-L-fucose synthase